MKKENVRISFNYGEHSQKLVDAFISIGGDPEKISYRPDGYVFWETKQSLADAGVLKDPVLRDLLSQSETIRDLRVEAKGGKGVSFGVPAIQKFEPLIDALIEEGQKPKLLKPAHHYIDVSVKELRGLLGKAKPEASGAFSIGLGKVNAESVVQTVEAKFFSLSKQVQNWHSKSPEEVISYVKGRGVRGKKEDAIVTLIGSDELIVRGAVVTAVMALPFAAALFVGLSKPDQAPATPNAPPPAGQNIADDAAVQLEEKPEKELDEQTRWREMLEKAGASKGKGLE